MEHSGLDLLTLSFSHFDPDQTNGLSNAAIACPNQPHLPLWHACQA